MYLSKPGLPVMYLPRQQLPTMNTMIAPPTVTTATWIAVPRKIRVRVMFRFVFRTMLVLYE